MSIELAAFAPGMTDAVKHFWSARESASQQQTERGASDQGRRSEVTTGKNLDGFVSLVRDLAVANGLPEQSVHFKGPGPTLPGFFRCTKKWDVVVVNGDRLIAAIEFKSQVGPSFGNNVNNRTEEAIGNAVDLLTAHRERAFGDSPRPFLGYVFVLEDCAKSTKPLDARSKHFKQFPEFNRASYAQRYEILCRKLVQEQLYDAAALVLTKSDAGSTGAWRSLSAPTDPNEFARQFAGRVAAEAATQWQQTLPPLLVAAEPTAPYKTQD